MCAGKKNIRRESLPSGLCPIRARQKQAGKGFFIKEMGRKKHPVRHADRSGKRVETQAGASTIDHVKNMGDIDLFGLLVILSQLAFVALIVLWFALNKPKNIPEFKYRFKQAFLPSWLRSRSAHPTSKTKQT